MLKIEYISSDIRFGIIWKCTDYRELIVYMDLLLFYHCLFVKLMLSLKTHILYESTHINIWFTCLTWQPNRDIDDMFPPSQMKYKYKWWCFREPLCILIRLNWVVTLMNQNKWLFYIKFHKTSQLKCFRLTDWGSRL